MMPATVRRFSLMPDPAVFMKEKERRPSEQDMADSAMLFLERRRSSDQSIGSIQPDLYRRRGSVITQQAEGGRSIIARCQLQISYDFGKSDLHVAIADVCDVSSLDSFHVSISLTESSMRRESSKALTGAIFHREDFKFPMSFDDVMDRNLTIEMHGSRNGGSPTVVGVSSVRLASLEISTDDILLWTDIEERDACETQGEVFVGVQYLPSAERLVVTLHQARNLPSRDALPNAYAKLLVLQDGKVLKKRKSSVRKNSQSPIWNEALNFSVANLQNCQVELQILDYDRIGNHRMLGQIVFGGESRDRMWKDLVSGKSVNPKWLPLKYI